MKKQQRKVVNIYEPYETTLLSSLLKEGDTAIDLGSSKGHYTFRFSNAVGETGEVFAFEPDPKHCNLVNSKLQSHTPANIHLIQKAVSNKPGNGFLYLNLSNTGDHRIYDSGDNRYAIPIKTVRLDTFFLSYKKPIALIKMDIQGTELAALEGMASLLRRNPGVTIATEFWPFGLKTFGAEPLDYLATLQHLGFTLQIISEASKKLEPVSAIQSLITRYPPISQRYTNLLCTR